MDSDSFWGLTPLLFNGLMEDYWEKERLKDMMQARTVVSQENIFRRWANGQMAEGAAPMPMVDDLGSVRLIQEKGYRPGWVKTVAGWVKQEELDRFLGG